MATHRSYKFQLKIGEKRVLFTLSYGDADAGATAGANTRWVEEVTRYLKRVISSPSSFSSPWRPPLSTFHSRLECHPLQPLPPPPPPPPKLHPGITGKTDTLLSSRRRFIYYPRLLQRTAASDQLSVLAASTRCMKRVFIATRNRISDLRPRAAFFAD